MDTPCTVLSLLHGISCNESKDHGNIALRIERSNTLSGTSANIVKVRRISSHDTAKSDDCVHLFALYKLGRAINKFKTTGDCIYSDVFRFGAMLL